MAKKTYFEEHEARPLVLQLLSTIEKMHRMGIVHRDLNPGNIFLHFPEIPFPSSPEIDVTNKLGSDAESKFSTLFLTDIFVGADSFLNINNPMKRVTGSQIKIIDFNHSRMFNLDDSPFRVRQ